MKLQLGKYRQRTSLNNHPDHGQQDNCFRLFYSDFSIVDFNFDLRYFLKDLVFLSGLFFGYYGELFERPRIISEIKIRTKYVWGNLVDRPGYVPCQGKLLYK